MKKILLLMFAFLMLFSTVALANEEVVGTESLVYTEESEIDENSINPKYTYLGFMTAGLHIDENGHAIFSGSARAPYHDVRICVYLQRSKNELIWDDIIGSIRTVYDNGAVSKEWNLPANDYFYRTKVIVEVLDDEGNIIETQKGYSDSERY